MLHGHGDDIYRYGRKIEYNFSSNVYPAADVSELLRYLSECRDALVSYPDPAAENLSEKIAGINGISLSSVCVTNGATEAIYLIASAWRGARSAVIVPTFTEYADSCRMHAHRVTEYSAEDFAENRLAADEDIVWLCNPNNPDGRVWEKETLKSMICEHPQRLFVIDQSYEDFTDRWLFNAEETVSFPNLITLHSMTKKYRSAGLRLGYAIASPSLIDRISCMRMPWSVNGMAIAAGEYLVNRADKSYNINAYLQDAERLRRQLNEIEGITVIPSHTHFFLVRLERGTSSELKTFLAENCGLLIRDASNFSGLDNRYVRISAQQPAANDLLVNSVRQWMRYIM